MELLRSSPSAPESFCRTASPGSSGGPRKPAESSTVTSDPATIFTSTDERHDILIAQLSSRAPLLQDEAQRILGGAKEHYKNRAKHDHSISTVHQQLGGVERHHLNADSLIANWVPPNVLQAYRWELHQADQIVQFSRKTAGEARRWGEQQTDKEHQILQRLNTLSSELERFISHLPLRDHRSKQPLNQRVHEWQNHVVEHRLPTERSDSNHQTAALRSLREKANRLRHIKEQREEWGDECREMINDAERPELLKGRKSPRSYEISVGLQARRKEIEFEQQLLAAEKDFLDAKEVCLQHRISPRLINVGPAITEMPVRTTSLPSAQVVVSSTPSGIPFQHQLQQSEHLASRSSTMSRMIDSQWRTASPASMYDKESPHRRYATPETTGRGDVYPSSGHGCTAQPSTASNRALNPKAPEFRTQGVMEAGPLHTVDASTPNFNEAALYSSEEQQLDYPVLDTITEHHSDTAPQETGSERWHTFRQGPPSPRRRRYSESAYRPSPRAVWPGG